MFSSESFLQLVFANETDTYYCEDLLRLSLNQYLWKMLHRKYRAVYFLREEDGMLHVQTFGDPHAAAFAYHKKKWFGKQNDPQQFIGWMKKQLTSDTVPCAFVCSAAEFCNVCEQPQWLEELQALSHLEHRSGTLLLTLPPIAERSRHCLLHSPVFEKLGDNVILSARRGSIRNFYLTLKTGKGDGCVFLNAFSAGRVRAMLLHTMMQQEDYCDDARLDAMAEYLTQLLNNRRLQWKDRLFAQDFRLLNPTYNALLCQLQKPEIWKSLVQRAEEVRDAGGLRAYVHSRDADYCDESCADVRIVHEEGSYACECMSLRPPKHSDSAGASHMCVETMLMDIYHELSIHQNCEENRRVTKAIRNFLITLGNAEHMGDRGTYRRVLYAVQFCVRCLYAPECDEKEIESILAALESYLSLSGQTYQTGCNYENIAKKEGGKLSDQLTAQLENQYRAQSSALAAFDDGIDSRLQHYSPGQTQGDFQEIAAELHGMLDTLEQDLTREPEPAPQPAPPPPPAQEDEEEEELFITADMFGDAPKFRP